jgi:4-amino-4-deoxy-L-arabinose transferase-like glycosyltransferase
MMLNNNTRNILVLIGLAYIFLMLGNGILALTNPDEVFYAQTAKEMVQQKSWLVPYLFGQPQFEKPILTYWLLRVGFMLFGFTAFSARFFPALFGIIGVIAVYSLALLGFKDKQKAFLSALILMSSGFYIAMSRMLFTDLIFSVLILLSLLCFYWGYSDRKRKAAGIILFFVFSAFSVLAKGPLGFIITILTVLLFLLYRKETNFLFCRNCLAGFVLFLLVALPWYIFVINKYGQVFIKEFFINDHLRRLVEAEHRKNDTWYFYPLSIVLLMVPWCFYVATSFFSFLKELRKKQILPVYAFLGSWVIIVFFTFQIAHSKLTSYILPLFPALALITADFLHNCLKKRERFLKISLMIIWAVFLLIAVALPIAANKYSAYLPGKTSFYGFLLIYTIVLLVMLSFIQRKRFLASLVLLAFQLPVILFFALSECQGFQDYFSSQNPGTFLMKNYKIDNTIICSKMLVRGVRFYTDKEVAVVNIGGKQFFSPHPLPYLDSNAKLSSFLRTQKITYGIVSKSALDDIKRLAKENNLECEILKVFGKQYVIIVRALS